MKETITRKFRLLGTIDETVFTDFRVVVNTMITEGLKLSADMFEDEGLKSVKRFYDKLSLDLSDLKLHNRTLRCGAQYAYFALSEYHRRLNLVSSIAKALAENSCDFSKVYQNICKDNKLSYVWIENLTSHVRNLLLEELKKKNFVIRPIIFKPSLDIDALKKNFFRRLSLRLTKLVKRKKTTPLIENIGIDNWAFNRKQWRNKRFSEIRVPELIQLEVEDPSIGQLLTLWLEETTIRPFIQGDTDEDFTRFILAFLQADYNEACVEALSGDFQKASISILEDITTNPAKFEKVPVYSKSSIPFGIDDNYVYKEPTKDNDFMVTLTLRPRDPISVRLSEPERFEQLLDEGFVPKRATLIKSGGKFILAVPFEKELPDLPLVNKRVAGVDAGLKVFQVISVFAGDTEVARKFLDQADIVGRIEDVVSKKGDFVNFKRKLQNLRSRGRYLQSELHKMKKAHGRIARHFQKYRRLRCDLKRNWRKIGNVHRELAIQIALRVVYFCQYHEVDCIHLEDLSWSRHTKKEDVGFWLATWQIHWFFSRIQSFIVSFGRRVGINVIHVDPRNTSKLCSHCGKMGIRDGKRFHCDHCNFHLDSDLNSARNLAQAIP